MFIQIKTKEQAVKYFGGITEFRQAMGRGQTWYYTLPDEFSQTLQDEITGVLVRQLHERIGETE